MIKQSDLSKIKNLPADTNGALNGKSNNGHTHDDRYYQKSEVESKLNGKANSNHTHSNLNAQFSAIQIPAGSDLNNYTTPGLYFSPSDADAQKIKNVAHPASFSLFVEKHAGTKQTFTLYWTDNPKSWYRNFYNGKWGGWITICDGINSPNGLAWWDTSRYWSKVPYIKDDGVMEVGKYIDFHELSNDTNDYNIRIEAKQGVLNCWEDFSGNNLWARKYLRINDWYGKGSDGRIYYYEDGKQMITENVEVFESKKLKAKEGGITAEGPIYAWRANITTDKDLVFGGKCLSTIQSGGANLYCEGRGGGTHGWHFADVTGQYADIYAKVYRQQSDARTKQEIPKLNTLNHLLNNHSSIESENILDKISKVETKEYFYYNDESKKHILGFFAQDLEKEFPLTVDTMNFSEEEIQSGNFEFPKDKEGHDIHDLKTIDSMAVSAVMWKGIQELNKKLKMYEDRIQRLETELESLKK